MLYAQWQVLVVHSDRVLSSYQVVTVVLENYETVKDSSNIVSKDSSVEVVHPEGSVTVPPASTLRVPSWRRIVTETGEANVSM